MQTRGRTPALNPGACRQNWGALWTCRGERGSFTPLEPGSCERGKHTPSLFLAVVLAVPTSLLGQAQPRPCRRLLSGCQCGNGLSAASQSS